jgi:hypothetical protein
VRLLPIPIPAREGVGKVAHSIERQRRGTLCRPGGPHPTGVLDPRPDGRGYFLTALRALLSEFPFAR